MHCSTAQHPTALTFGALVIGSLLLGSAVAAAQGRVISAYPHTQSFAFVPSGTAATPNGPIGTALFPTTDVDGGELTVDAGTSATMVNGSSTGINNNVGAGGALRIQTSGSALPTAAQGFVVHCSFSGRFDATVSIDWTKVSNGRSTRANELRIAVSADNGAFVDVTSASFDNSGTAQSGTLTAILPTTLDGVAGVRIRISSVNVSGTGTHPRVVVDNLVIDADEDTPLPIELASFTASHHEGRVGLAWSTASEHENAGFEVLRARADDSVFTPVASFLTDEALRGLGTSATGRAYRFEDELPASLRVDGTVLLYRLVDVATDGTRTINGTREVSVDRQPAPPPPASIGPVRLRLETPHPLPARDLLHARWSQAAREPVTIEIVDASGARTTVLAPTEMGAGDHEHAVALDGLPSGPYTLVVRTNAAQRTRSFVVAR